MKKLFICFLILAMSFTFTPTIHAAGALSLGDAHSGIVQIKLFTLSEDRFLTNNSNGSGVIISADGLVLTNYHVVSEEEDYDNSLRDVGYQICLTVEQDIEPECKYTAKFIASDKDRDLALLKIQNISGLSSESMYPYFDLSVTSPEASSDITVLGYPGIGGKTITITQGTVSGKTNKYNLDWIKTDADISFGNSGGAGINSDGEVVGITTKSHSDMLGSVGYLVDISSVKSWIDSNKNKSLQTSSFESRIIEFTKKKQDLKVSDDFTISYPALKISKPEGWEFGYNREDSIAVYNDNDDDAGIMGLTLLKFSQDIVKTDIDWVFKLDNIEYISFLTIVKSEDINIGGREGKKITYSIMGSPGKVYYIPHKEYVVKIEYDYGSNEKDKEKIDTVINSIKLNDFVSKLESVEKYRNDFHKFNIDISSSDWSGETYDSIETPFLAYGKNIRDSFFQINIAKRDDSTAGLSNNEIYNRDINDINEMRPMLQSVGVDMEINNASSYTNLGKNINDAIMMEAEMTKGEDVIAKIFTYEVYLEDKIISISFTYFGENEYDEAVELFKNAVSSFVVDDYSPASISEEILVLNGADTSVEIGENTNNEDDNTIHTDENEADELPLSINLERITVKDKGMYSNLKGKIMLKVEDAGKAYYVNPKTEIMHYLGRPDDAFAVMREQGVGITNSDLYKIPVGVSDNSVDTDGDGLSDNLENTLGLDLNKSDTDGDGYNDKDELENGYNPWGAGKQNIDSGFSSNQKGKILLQVEKNGEAWYINPGDGKRYFLGRPSDAFNVMRNLGLGISNSDFNSMTQ